MFFHVDLSQDDKMFSYGQLWDRGLWTFEAFCLVQVINMMKRSAIALPLPSWPKLTILLRVSQFFNFSHNKTPNLMVFREISFWNEVFLCSIKTEMFTVNSPYVNTKNCKLYNAVSKRLHGGFVRNLSATCSPNATKRVKVRFLPWKPCLFSLHISFKSA